MPIILLNIQLKLHSHVHFTQREKIKLYLLTCASSHLLLQNHLESERTMLLVPTYTITNTVLSGIRNTSIYLFPIKALTQGISIGGIFPRGIQKKWKWRGRYPSILETEAGEVGVDGLLFVIGCNSVWLIAGLRSRCQV